MDKLQEKSGAEFDKGFCEHAIKDHVEDIQKFEKARSEVQNPELKAFIEQTLPVLREHLQMAKNAGRVLGVDPEILAMADPLLQKGDQPMREALLRNGQVPREQAAGTPAKGEVGQGTGSRSPGTAERPKYGGNRTTKLSYTDLPAAVQHTIEGEGNPQSIRDIKTTTRKGQTVYVVKTERNGKNVTLRVAADGSLQKGGLFGLGR
jgi:hypothetical protein